MLRRTLLKWLGLAPAVVAIPKEKVIAESKPKEFVLEQKTITTSPIANMTVGEFADAKTVRMSPEELAYWDNYFKTKPIINRSMARPADEVEIARKEEIELACKEWCHKCNEENNDKSS